MTFFFGGCYVYALNNILMLTHNGVCEIILITISYLGGLNRSRDYFWEIFDRSWIRFMVFFL